MNNFLLKLNRRIYSEKEKIRIRCLTISSDSLFLIDIPTHLNIGDQAIAWAERFMVNTVLPDKNLISIDDNITEYTILKLKDRVQADNLILFHGGGNMSDVWVGPDHLRTQTLTIFKNKKIIILPQSIDYDLKRNNPDRIEMLHAFSKNTEHPVVFAREQLSYNYLKKILPDNCECHLVPDTVLFLSGKLSIPKDVRVNKITTFFRRDPEKKLDTKKIVNQIKSKYDLINSDTVNDTGTAITRKQFKELVRDKWKEFYTSKLIITDRLHGMIFAVITGTPAIVFDNSNHKIKSTYETWLKDVPYIHFIDGDNDQFDAMIEQMNKLIAQEENNPKEYEIPTFDDKFEPLIKVLKEAK